MPEKIMNLVSSPWIPVLKHDGTTELVSIRTAFSDANEFFDIASELPSMDFAIRRILLAVLYRATNEELEDDPLKVWKSWWNSGSLPLELIKEYLDEWEHRFNLFDKKAPFLQTPDLRSRKGEWNELKKMVIDSPGTGSLFSRTNPDQPIDPASAGRWLVHVNAFDVSGRKTGPVGDIRNAKHNGTGNPMGIGWSGWLGGTTIKGSNLFETLLLNLVCDRTYDDTAFEKDLPIWEEDPLPVGARSNAQPYGPVSLMTWPQRRIRLKVTDGLIDGVLICNGDAVDYTQQWNNEYMSPWCYSKTKSSDAKKPIYMPNKLQLERAMWRGIATLLPSQSPEQVKAPDKSLVSASLPAKNVEWIGKLTERRILPRDFKMTMEVVSVAYGTQNSVVDHVVHDVLTFPSLLAIAEEGESLRNIVTTAVSRADSAVNALAKFAGNLARAEGADPDSITDAMKVERYTTFSLIDPLFRNWLANLDVIQENAEEELTAWTETIRGLIGREGERLVQNTSPNAWTGREIDGRMYNVGQAEAWFRAELNKILPKGNSEL